MSTSLDPNATDNGTLSEHADAFAESREQQFLEIAGEIGDDTDGIASETELQPDPADAEPAETEGAPAPEGTAPVADEDPLAGSTPMPYTVDGQAKTFDGIKVFTDASGAIVGGVIPGEAIKDVQYKIQRAEYLETQNATLYQQAQALERIEAKNGDETLSGLAAVEHYVTENAKLHAAVRILAQTLEDPEKTAAILTDPRELQLLQRELNLSARQAESKARAEWGTRSTQHVRQAQESTQVQETASRAITASIDQWASRYPALTADDKAAVRSMLEQVGSAIVRRATPEEARQAGVRVGELVIDHRVVDQALKDRHTLRAQATDAAKAAQNAAAENARRLAATAAGKRGQKPAASSKTSRPAPAAPEKSKAELWQEQKDRMLTGRFGVDDDE